MNYMQIMWVVLTYEFNDDLALFVQPCIFGSAARHLVPYEVRVRAELRTLT